MATLHPAGVHHPQPGAAEGAATKEMTDEVAVMIECLEPLVVSPEAEKASIAAYATSWARGPGCWTSDRGLRRALGLGARGPGPPGPVVVRRAGGGRGPEPELWGRSWPGGRLLGVGFFAVAFFARAGPRAGPRVVARAIGVPTTEIRLFVFGGVARITGAGDAAAARPWWPWPGRWPR